MALTWDNLLGPFFYQVSCRPRQGRGGEGVWGEQQMAQQTRQLIQPNYGNRCLKMLAFKFKLLGLLEEPTRMGRFGLPLN